MISRANQPPVAAEFDALAMVDGIIHTALERRASDIHIEPTAEGVEVRLRIDGLLEVQSQHTAASGRCMVSRMMVMAHLLTYRLDVPQEGRMQVPVQGGPALDLRLAIMPTTHGLRAAVRMPAELIQPRTLDELGLPARVLAGLKTFAAGESGMLLVTGPAGSGKTTTIYALLTHIVQNYPGLSIITLEDPVERHVPGITQIEVSPFGQLTYERALRSILRQDPQVLMLGEIRDAATASLAAQAALSGHRLICTLHASTPGGAIARLLEMGLEPYRITSSVYGVIAQRLLRRLSRTFSPSPGTPGEGRGEGSLANDKPAATSPQNPHPNPLPEYRERGQKYKGRIPVAEFVPLTAALRNAVLAGADASQLQQLAQRETEYSSLRDSAHSLVAQHLTDLEEVQRVLGFKPALQGRVPGPKGPACPKRGAQ